LDNWEAVVTGVLVLLMVGVLATGRWAPDAVMLGVLLVLLITGILEPTQAVAGFANEGVITVGMLYVLATGLRETGAMNAVTDRMLGRPRSALGAQARLAIPVVGLSAFINNTPIVAMFLPTLASFARRAGISPARLFMPLSFASILGGVCTLIGTSTNVVVARLVNQSQLTDTRGEPLSFGMFTITRVGLPIALIGLAYMLLFGRRLLPDRAPKAPAPAAGYHAALRVGPGCPAAGKTVERAGLRGLPGVFLARIERDGETVTAVGPDEIVRVGDDLVFVGDLPALVELQQMRGLTPSDRTGANAGYRPDQRLTEAVVASDSSLVGSTIRESGVRTRFGAVVVAVRRQGQDLPGRLGDIRLRAGDTLLLEAPPGLARRVAGGQDFYLASEVGVPAALRHERAWVALGVLALLIGLISFEVLDTMTASMLAAALMVLTRCCTGSQARRGVDFQILVVIGAAFGIAQAMESTGLAAAVAEGIVSVASGLGPWGLLAGVYALTVVFTACMTNNAAAVLMFPIAVAIAAREGVNPMPFAIAVAVAASCEFSTPIGYQTNLMVMGPGGYRWVDYLRFGGPLTLLCGLVCVLLAPAAFGGFGGGGQ
jgi:di/tricarboxylate transporter